jgi:hypothetical protein
MTLLHLHRRRRIQGNRVYNVGNGSVAACHHRLCFVGLPNKLDIYPPANTKPAPRHSTRHHGSRCLLNNRLKDLKTIVSAVV